MSCEYLKAWCWAQRKRMEQGKAILVEIAVIEHIEKLLKKPSNEFIQDLERQLEEANNLIEEIAIDHDLAHNEFRDYLNKYEGWQDA